MKFLTRSLNKLPFPRKTRYTPHSLLLLPPLSTPFNFLKQEPVLPDATNDLHVPSPNGHVPGLSLLDFSAVFDVVDHSASVKLSTPSVSVGI